MPATQPTALLVIGMHRSGTSALTRVLSLLGAELPGNLAGPNPGNESGYWESLDLNALNEEILNSLALSWDSLAKFPDRWHDSPSAALFRQKISAFVRREFPQSPLFVLKDPRISRLVPLWAQTLTEIGIRPVFIIALRNPLEVAASLERLYPIPPQRAMLLWLRYMLDAERSSRPFTRAIIQYDDLLSDWPATITRLSRHANIQWPRTISQAAPEIQAYLAPRLRHFRIPTSALESDPTIVWWIKALYATLQSSTRGPISVDLHTLCDHLDKLLNDAHLIYGPLLHQLSFEVADLKQQLSRHLTPNP